MFGFRKFLGSVNPTARGNSVTLREKSYRTQGTRLAADFNTRGRSARNVLRPKEMRTDREIVDERQTGSDVSAPRFTNAVVPGCVSGSGVKAEGGGVVGERVSVCVFPSGLQAYGVWDASGSASMERRDASSSLLFFALSEAQARLLHTKLPAPHGHTAGGRR